MTDSDSSRGSDVQSEASPRPWAVKMRLEHAWRVVVIVDANGEDVLSKDIYPSPKLLALIVAAVNAYAPPSAPAKGRMASGAERFPLGGEHIQDDPELTALIERARNHVMTPEEIAEQRRSWVRGQLGLTHPDWPKDYIARLVEATDKGEPFLEHLPSGTGGERGPESRMRMDPDTRRAADEAVAEGMKAFRDRLRSPLPSSEPAQETQRGEDATAQRIRDLQNFRAFEHAQQAAESQPDELTALRAENERLREIRHLAQTACAAEWHHQRFDRALRDLRAALAKEQGG